MDWTMYIAIGLCALTFSSLIMNYCNHKELKRLRSKACDANNKIDYLERECIRNQQKDDAGYIFLRDKIYGIQDNLKYMYLDKKETYAMWDIHNARVNSYCEDMIRESSNINALLPLLPLADKFDIKFKLKNNKLNADDLKADLKEIERELKAYT